MMSSGPRNDPLSLRCRNRRPRPVTVYQPQKGSKPKRGIRSMNCSPRTQLQRPKSHRAAFSSRSLSPAGSSEVSFAPGAIVRHAPAPPHAIAPVDRARLGVRSVDCTFVASDTGDLECGARRLSAAAAPDRSLKNVLNDPSPITLKLCKGTGQKEPRRRARRWMRKRLLTSSADAWHLQLLSCAKALVPRRSTLGHR